MSDPSDRFRLVDPYPYGATGGELLIAGVTAVVAAGVIAGVVMLAWVVIGVLG